MGKEVEWDKQAVGDFIMEHGHAMVRVRTPRGLVTRLREHFEDRLYGKCFRNALVVAAASKGRLWYCEGFAQTRRNGYWHPHGWVSPRGGSLKPVDQGNWAIDPTWPWKTRGNTVDDGCYAGVMFDPHHVLDFIHWMQRVTGEWPSSSIFKNIDAYRDFRRGL